jgi:hypothetical protein
MSFSCGTDTVYVPLITRILAFTAAGKYAREFKPVPAVGRFPVVLGCRKDRWVGWTQVGPPVTTEGVHRERAALAWYDLSGRPLALIDTFPMEDHTYGPSRPEGRAIA